MYFQKIFIQQVAKDANLNQETQTEVKLNDTNSDAIISPDAAIAAGSTIGFIMIWAGFLFILSKMRTLTEDNKIFLPLTSSHKLPCYTCRYFSNNHYLHCAVQPSIVLTEEAMNCSDYCPKHGKFFK
ncbi:hypothetical protein [Fischerella sp. PCC 9605]|uniref:hypothetical protein n=1 Tax=Fischerella sp. PCC 9605 TaxID=1173024 RepID=UPI000479CDC5|nr:hypothetical protein [Fischerella sp. PCC 9605]